MKTSLSAAAPTSAGPTISLPATSLTVTPDDGQAAVAPQTGDTVDLQITGTVVSLDGGQAQISIASVNGQPVGAGGDLGDASDPNTSADLDDAGAGGSGDMEAHLRRLASRADDEEGD